MQARSKKKLKTVITASGNTELFKDCILINDLYYLKDKECTKIGNKWFLLTDKNIKLDHETGEYFLLSPSSLRVRKQGVVSINDESIQIGFFTPNSYKNCVIRTKTGEEYLCINYTIARSAGYIEHINENLWVHSSNFKSQVKEETLSAILPKNTLDSIMNVYKNSESEFKKPRLYKYDTNSYNMEDSKEFYNISNLYKKYNTELSKDSRKAAKLLGNITFGAEIECRLGTLPDNIMNQLGVIICKDGSINYSPEFVTVPYSGAKGLQSLKNLFNELNKRCTTDYNCSLHYHIGTIRKDREFIVALYKLYFDIQKELHGMLPFYKTDWKNVKKQAYCDFLNKSLITPIRDNIPYKDKIRKAYINIQFWALGGILPCKDFNRKVKKHPKGDKKWNWENRYFSLNFLNMFISNRDTIEFRAHHSVLNDVKAINWLFICAAIIKYSENNSSKIINSSSTIKLEDVLDYYGDTFKTTYAKNVSNYLKEYVKHRTAFFKSKTDDGDKIVESDYTEKNYTFDSNGLNCIY